MDPKHTITSTNLTRTMLALLVTLSLLASNAEGGILSRSDNDIQSAFATGQTVDRQSQTVDRLSTDSGETREPPVTSSDLPKQIPAPPQPPFASTPHYEQQIARFVWETPHFNTPYPPVIQT
ncbi:uncharacterized protein LOC111046078 [Nilaparvata lugens]|uniref:uncharacterized protein LOC111046078 n=1 Tax=Nilaparvata lugens TaxID=108931 RepID=UPI00193E2DCD|nr:uncharacterized protein LOC111046078 [Nilaparvata lugens]